jgi:hypothetical protein
MISSGEARPKNSHAIEKKGNTASIPNRSERKKLNKDLQGTGESVSGIQGRVRFLEG